LTCALIHLVLVMSMFTIVTVYFGLPIHLFRELYMAFHSFREKLIRFYRYRKLVKNLQDQFPYATEEELDAVDRQCIICREEMPSGKKLPCGHIFHL
jgi:E3 ubiquitin-protein ligase synoviolin